MRIYEYRYIRREYMRIYEYRYIRSEYTLRQRLPFSGCAAFNSKQP